MLAKLLSDKRPIVRVTINGKDTAMLIDTGASINVIDQDVLKSFGIKKRSVMGTINGAGGTVCGM